jgi:hypothetical protein
MPRAIAYRVSDGIDDCCASFVCQIAPGGKWYVRSDLHPNVYACLERDTGKWLPFASVHDAKVHFDTSEEALAAAVKKHDEERARL